MHLFLTCSTRRVGDAEEISDEASESAPRGTKRKEGEKSRQEGEIEGCTSHSASSSFNRRHGAASASCNTTESIIETTRVYPTKYETEGSSSLALHPFFLSPPHFQPGFHVSHPSTGFVLARGQPHGRCSPRTGTRSHARTRSSIHFRASSTATEPAICVEQVQSRVSLHRCFVMEKYTQRVLQQWFLCQMAKFDESGRRSDFAAITAAERVCWHREKRYRSREKESEKGKTRGCQMKEKKRERRKKGRSSSARCQKEDESRLVFGISTTASFTSNRSKPREESRRAPFPKPR